MKAEVYERKKTCPRCNAMFTCNIENCWCNQMPKVMAISANHDCLCPACLKAAIENRLKTVE